MAITQFVGQSSKFHLTMNRGKRIFRAGKRLTLHHLVLDALSVYLFFKLIQHIAAV